MQNTGSHDFDLERLTRFGDVLIQANDRFPTFSEVPGIAKFLTKAIAACGQPREKVALAVELLDDIHTLEGAKQFSLSQPEHFAIASNIVAGAYYMSPDILKLLGYSLERHNPADVEDFVKEYQTGIVDPVLERGRLYIDPAS